MVILPPYAHTARQFFSKAGIFATISLPPGAQGATITGIHGMGVSTPMAADVADATVGLAMERHIPKGMMFTMGAKSMMLACNLF